MNRKRITLKEQLKVIPEDEWILLVCDEKKILGYKNYILQCNLYLGKKVKTIQIHYHDDTDGIVGDVLRIEVEE